LEKVVRARENIIEVISHDLKTPLTAIQLGASHLSKLLQRESAAGRITEIILGATQRMNRLVCDIVDLVKFDSSGLAIQKKPVSVAAVLNSTSQVMLPIAEDKAVRLTILAREAGELTVSGDTDRLLQVLFNLISNAIHHTPREGAIRVSAAAQKGSVLFEVTDTGPGIAKESIPKIFERYWTANHGKRGSAGLGLSISKIIVESHGGQIGVDSELGKGCTFWFSIPTPVLG
jgi:signal transduction histidine kinase